MIKKLASHLGEYRRAAILTPMFSALEAVMDILLPTIMAFIIDLGIEKGDMNAIVKYGLLTFAVAAIALLLGVLAGRYAAEASTGFAGNLRDAMYENIQHYSFSNIDKFSTAGLVTRMTTDVTNLQNAFQMMERMCVRAPVHLVFALIMAFGIGGPLALIFVAAVAFLLAVLASIMVPTFKIFDRVFKNYDNLNSSVQENVSAIRVVKSFVREGFENEKYTKACEGLYQQFVNAESRLSFNGPAMLTAIYGCNIALSWFGAKYILHGALTTGQLNALFGYIMNILMALMMLSMAFVMISMSAASVKRIVEVLDEKTDLPPAKAPVQEVKDGSIRFDHVTFKYKHGSGQPVLNDITFDIKPGETLGIIGGTGSAKSSLVQLIPRLYDAETGTVSVGGVNVRDYNLDVLRHEVSMVLQKNVLFSGTILDNLRWGNENASEEECIRVAKLACADEFIERFPDKYNTWIEQGGSNVSGGQKQRLTIARALLRKPKVLILDEPTSALAFDEVKSLFKVIESLKAKGIGIIYITHRLTEVFDIADRVSVMCDGIIAMQGKVSEFTRDDLIRGLLPPDTKKREAKSAPRPVSEIDYNAQPVLELQDFTGYGFSHVNLKIYPGEMVGLAGVVGAGRTEMATTIFGRDKVLGGKVLLDGKDITGESTRQVIEEGINYVSEDRFANGIFRIRDVAENTTAAILNGKRLGSFFLNRAEEDKISQSYVDNFHTKVTGLDQEVGSLSGGNQQKIIIARAFASEPRLVILDEPTRGIDAAARGDVYAVLQELRKTGVSILLISSDMEEVVELADRAVTMFQGRINHEFKKGEITQDNLMAASFGVYHEKAGVKVAS